MRLTSFNVNSIRAIRQFYKEIHAASFSSFLKDILQVDILAVQETKVNELEKLDTEFSFCRDYDSYFAFHRICKKVGYSGVATFVKKGTKLPVQRVEYGFSGTWQLPDEKNMMGCYVELYEKYEKSELKLLDSEGRVVITDHGMFILINVYFPNDRDQERMEFKMKFHEALLVRANSFWKNGRAVIIAGDFNACYLPIDHCEYADIMIPVGTSREAYPMNHLTETMSMERVEQFLNHKPRQWMQDTIQSGWIDTFRLFHEKEQGKFTCWNMKLGSRKSNYGARIDYILVSPNFQLLYPQLMVEATVQTDIMGSDHCPVELILNEDVIDAYRSTAERITGNRGVGEQRRISDFFKRALTGDRSETFSKSQKKMLGYDEKKDEAVENIEENSIETVDKSTIENKIDDRDSPNISGKWNILFQKATPCCKVHNEPCKLQRVSKKGPNNGRFFYSCSRPPGPKSDLNGRCSHFEWSNG